MSAPVRGWAMWGWPLALALLTAVGLLSALLGDDLWDAASWVALGVPTGACLWFGWRGRGASKKSV